MDGIKWKLEMERMWRGVMCVWQEVQRFAVKEITEKTTAVSAVSYASDAEPELYF